MKESFHGSAFSSVPGNQCSPEKEHPFLSVKNVLGNIKMNGNALANTRSKTAVIHQIASEF